MPTPADERMIALMRVVLAFSAFLLVVISRTNLPIPLLPLCGALTIYVFYSLALYPFCPKGRSEVLRSETFLRLQHWIDIGYYSLLIWWSGGSGSPFFIFYFFPILVAASRGGYVVGLQATLASSMLVYGLGFFSTAAADQTAGADQVLLRPAYVLILGYIIAFLGDSNLRARRRLFLLKEMNSLSNPRFGVERTLSVLTERIREFYEADKCVMVLAQWHQMEPHLRRALREENESALNALPLAPEVQKQLLERPGSQILWQRRMGLESGHRIALHVFDPREGEFKRLTTPSKATTESKEKIESLESLADILEADEFFSMPMNYRGTVRGRLFVIGARRSFGVSEALFLMQAIEHIMPALDNTLLLDRLASDAAEEERQRIARDLHDSIIQPYIGLRMGLVALSKELPDNDKRVQTQVQRLLQMTDLGIEGLYGYVTNLKSTGRANGNLRASLERFVERFSVATTIAVEIEMDESLKLGDRLAAEVFQMVSEGLSNIRRHTSSTQAQIQIRVRDGHLELQIANESSAPTAFIPRSIAERAAALGGTAKVKNSG